MQISLTPYAVACLVPAAMCATLALHARSRRRTQRGARAFAWLMGALTIWTLAYAMMLMDSGLAWKMFWWRIQYIGVAAVPLAWLQFAIEYTGSMPDHRAPLRPLAVVPLFTLLLAWTNDWHGLIWADYELYETGSLSIILVTEKGSWFFVNVAYSYALLAIGSALILRGMLRLPVYDRQALVVLTGAAMPWIANVVYLAGLRPDMPLDPTPFTFALGCLALAFGMKRYQLLDLTPVARASIIESLHDGIMVLDRLGRIVDLNPATTAMLAIDRRQLIGKPLGEVLEEARPLIARTSDAQPDGLEIERLIAGSNRTLRLSSSPMPDRRAGICGTLLVMRDLTDEKRARDQAHALAFRDPLTGLPNRDLFRDRFEHALSLARHGSGQLACLFFDLDDFKKINDHYGHTQGDQLLRRVARRIGEALRESDTVARLGSESPTLARFGGDEFVVLLQGLDGPEDANPAVQRVLHQLRRPFAIGDAIVSVRASIGVAVWPQDGESVEALLRNADAAMYEAKADGGDRARFFTQSIHDRVEKRLAIESDLHRALERDEFSLLYQPVYSISSGRIAAAEALVRWNHPRRGVVAPDQFIPVAEQSGLMLPIGEHLLRKVCVDWRPVYESVGATIRIAVNLSPRQFSEPDAAAHIEAILREAALPGHVLEVEVTELALMRSASRARAILGQLRAAGVQVAIDDFGMGYSSLGTLQDLTIDRLKIDRQFIVGVGQDPRAESLLRAMLAMARNLDLEVVGEGVETRDQLEFLRSEGCDRAQGFLLSEPVEIERLIEMLDSDRGELPSSAIA